MNALRENIRNRKSLFGMVLTILGLCVVALIWGMSKQGVTYDEMLSYQRASEMYADYAERIDFEWQREGFYNQKYNSNDFMNNFAIKEGESFFDQSLFVKTIDSFSSKRTYNVLLNIVMSLGDRSFNQWYSIGINLFLYIFTLFLFIKIAGRLQISDLFTIAALLFYGCSVAAIKPIIFLRFYEFYILVSLLFLYIGIDMYQRKKMNGIWILEAILTLILTWIGYLNAEYMMIYAGSFVVAFVFCCILGKEWKRMLALGGIYLGAGLSFVIVKFEGLKSTYESGGIFANAVNKFFSGELKEFLCFFAGFCKDIFRDGAIAILLVVLLLAVISCKDKKEAVQHMIRKVNIPCVIVFTTALVYVCLVARVTPFEAWRYTSVIQPLVVILLFALLDGVIQNIAWRKAAVGLLTIAGLVYACVWGRDIGCLIGETRYAMQEMVSNTLKGEANIMFASGDSGDFYYGAFLWPENTDVYVTNRELFAVDTREKEEVLSQDRIYIWVRDEDTWQTEIEPLIIQQGYGNRSMALDTESARWLIYRCERSE